MEDAERRGTPGPRPNGPPIRGPFPRVDPGPVTVAPPVAPVTAIDFRTDADDLIRHAFKAAQIEGREPFVRSLSINRAVAPISLLPDDAEIERSVTTDSSVVALARCPRGSLLLSVLARSASVLVSARTDDIAKSIIDCVRHRAPTSPVSGTVPVRTWFLTGHEFARSNDQHLEAPAWHEIARNYPPGVRDELEQLMTVERPTKSGKLILWHGEPGTGKTTALRALMREWEPWCAGQYISDPEELFSHPGYLLDVLSRSPVPRHGPTMTSVGEPEALWRLLVAEDSDEYLRASARRDAGAGLGRLLNLADGILGQGFNALILLTTNEELRRLHPALIRPGRCLARVEFRSFQPSEARAWLPEGVPQPGHDVTLADMFERCGDIAPIGQHSRTEPSTGAYL